MKKTLLTLALGSVALIQADGPAAPAGKDPLESAITKNNPGALKALLATYRANGLAVSAEAKGRLVALAQGQVEKKKTGKPFFKDWKSWGMFILSAGQSINSIGTIYKTILPSGNGPRGFEALKDPNNLFTLAAQGTMLVGGILLLRDMFKKSESKDEQEHKNAQKIVALLQEFPTVA